MPKYIMSFDVDDTGKMINAKRERELTQEDLYNEGIKDAWEAARKIALLPQDGGLGYYKLKEIFGEDKSFYIFKDFSGKEAIELMENKK